MLEIKRFEVDGLTFLSVLDNFRNSTPEWFVHGFLDSVNAEDPECDEVSEDSRMRFTTYSEGSIFEPCPWLKEHEIPITKAQIERAYAKAASHACHIVTTKKNYKLVGEVFLNKHPECRREPSADEAILAAALAERSATFDEDMYDC